MDCFLVLLFGLDEIVNGCWLQDFYSYLRPWTLRSWWLVCCDEVLGSFPPHVCVRFLRLGQRLLFLKVYIRVLALGCSQGTRGVEFRLCPMDAGLDHIMFVSRGPKGPLFSDS